MRVGNFNSQRPQYYDRNATFTSAFTSVSSTGAGSIVQNTSFYTVPAGKKYYLSVIDLNYICITGFTAGDYLQTTLSVMVGGVTQQLFARNTYYFSKVNDQFNIALPAGSVLNAGDVLRVNAVGNASGALYVLGYIYCGGTLFDA